MNNNTHTIEDPYSAQLGTKGRLQDFADYRSSAFNFCFNILRKFLILILKDKLNKKINKIGYFLNNDQLF